MRVYYHVRNAGATKRSPEGGLPGIDRRLRGSLAPRAGARAAGAHRRAALPLRLSGMVGRSHCSRSPTGTVITAMRYRSGIHS